MIWPRPQYCLALILIFMSLSLSVSRSVVPNSLWSHGLQLTRLLCPWDFPDQDTGVGCHFLLQGIFPTHELNPGLLHCRPILFQLSYDGSPVHSSEGISTQGLIIPFFLLCLCLEISKTKNLRKKFNIYAIFGECCCSKKRTQDTR